MKPSDVILRKALVGSGLDTKGWSSIHAGLRDRAFFSASVENVRQIEQARANVAAVADGKSMSEARRDLREVLAETGYAAGGKRGTIKDLLTKRRLDVMLKTNVDQAKGYASHLRATSEGAILAYPAYELVRVQERKAKRDWHARWNAAAAKVGFDGVAKNTSRMVALKTSPVWRTISAFGEPYPPFDFGSGMGVKDIAKSECRALGLLAEGEQPEVPPTANFNAGLEQPLPKVGDESLCADALRRLFGDQVEIAGGRVKWRGEIIREISEGKRNAATFGIGHAGERLALTRDLIAGVKDDAELIPTLWRSPDRVIAMPDGRTRLELDLMDGGRLVGIAEKGKGLVKVERATA